MLTRATRFVRTLRLGISRLATLRRRTPRVGYIGFHGQGNLGDDAMFEAARRLLNQVELITVGPTWQERWLSWLGLGGSRYFRTIILGGGTLIGPTYADRVAGLLGAGTPMFTLGTGVGSAGVSERDDVSIEGWSPLLERFQGVGVRGPRSQRALESIGVKGASVIGDLALGLGHPDASPCPAGRSFGLNLVFPSGWEQETRFAQNIAGLRETVISLAAAGWRPIPLTLAASDARCLRSFLEPTGTSLGDGEPIQSAEAFQEAVLGCAFTIGTRLHSAVLSCCAGVPPLMLGYRAKCLDFMESMGLEEFSCNVLDDDFGAIREKLNKLMREADTLRASIPTTVVAWQQKLRAYSQEIACFAANTNGTDR
jgi:polysaccharide pyruvyl transferase WcaK-like protein